MFFSTHVKEETVMDTVGLVFSLLVGAALAFISLLLTRRISPSIKTDIIDTLASLVAARSSTDKEPLTMETVQTAIEAALNKNARENRLYSALENFLWFVLGGAVSVVSPLITKALFGV